MWLGLILVYYGMLLVWLLAEVRLDLLSMRVLSAWVHLVSWMLGVLHLGLGILVLHLFLTATPLKVPTASWASLLRRLRHLSRWLIDDQVLVPSLSRRLLNLLRLLLLVLIPVSVLARSVILVIEMPAHFPMFFGLFPSIEPLIALDCEILVVDEGGLKSTEVDVVLLELMSLHLLEVSVLEAAERALVGLVLVLRVVLVCGLLHGRLLIAKNKFDFKLIN